MVRPTSHFPCNSNVSTQIRITCMFYYLSSNEKSISIVNFTEDLSRLVPSFQKSGYGTLGILEKVLLFGITSFLRSWYHFYMQFLFLKDGFEVLD